MNSNERITEARPRVEIQEGVVFGRGGGRELRCDIFRPPAAVANGRGVLLIHGGAWFRGDRSQLRGYGVLLGRAGYLSVATEYRLTPECKWPAQIHDVKTCVRYMRKNHEALGIDRDKIAAWGNSAGAHLALLLGGTAGVEELEGEGGHPDEPSHVAACVAFYPPVRCSDRERRDDAIPALFESDASDATLELASPLTHARADFPPTLLVHGNRDELVSVKNSLDMHAALRDVRAPVELHIFNGARHGFDASKGLGRISAQLGQVFLDRHL